MKPISKYKDTIITFVSIAAMAGVCIAILSFVDFPLWAAVLISLFAGAFLSSILSSFSKTYGQGKSYNIAVLGFPKSGKTTLIISLFREYFAGKIFNYQIAVKGSKTIERINEYLKLLENGSAIGPTNDQDRFSFRADITTGNGIFKKKYIAEFGDFPGDDSKTYFEQYGPWLHKTEFFKWVTDADAIVLIIDLGKYLIEGHSYIVEVSAALRTAWQNLIDLNEYQLSKIEKRPIVLAFTKTDLLQLRDKGLKTKAFKSIVMKNGFSDKVPSDAKIDAVRLNQLERMVENDFQELIKYFSSEIKHFNVVFCSSFSLDYDRRLGIYELLNSVLLR